MIKTTTCRSFTGRAHSPCKAGVDYKTVEIESGIESPPMYRTVIPCLPTWVPVSDEVLTKLRNGCPLADFPTQEEEDADSLRLEIAMKDRFEKMANNICPECDQPMTKVQSGRCVYAVPCGHRLYQGKLSK